VAGVAAAVEEEEEEEEGESNVLPLGLAMPVEAGASWWCP